MSGVSTLELHDLNVLLGVLSNSHPFGPAVASKQRGAEPGNGDIGEFLESLVLREGLKIVVELVLTKDLGFGWSVPKVERGVLLGFPLVLEWGDCHIRVSGRVQFGAVAVVEGVVDGFRLRLGLPGAGGDRERHLDRKSVV